MEQQLSILLVEDDPQSCEAFTSCFNETDGLFLTWVTDNPRSAAALVQAYTPHAIVWALELGQEPGAGLTILREISMLPPSLRPYTVVCISNCNKTLREAVHVAGGNYVLDKSPELVSEFLQATRHFLIQYKQSHRHLENLICAELDHINIPNTLLGYHYLVRAIQLSIENYPQRLYAVIAREAGKTEAAIERTIRYAIELAWKETDENILRKHYTPAIRSAKGVPTVGEFVYYYAAKLKREL